VSEDSIHQSSKPGDTADGNGVEPTASEPTASAATPASEPQAAPEQDPLEAAREEATRLRDQLLRTAADFDNFRKRSRREMEDAERRAREDLLRDLLPVFDNLERAVQHAEHATDVKSLAQGVEMVLRLFLDTLGKLGIQRIEALGQPFDPSIHDAVQQIETSEQPPGTVAAEIQAGYRMGEHLIRPSMVAVAKPPSN